MDQVKKYLSTIGRKGGRRSRRTLDSQTAREMVSLRESRRAFRKFYSQCFWSFNPHLKLELSDIPWICDELMKNGNRQAWEVARRLCR